MSGGGGKGGSSKTEVKIPAWLQDAAQANMARADKIAQIGYTPYYGPDVAAFNPTQQAAFQNTNDASRAFGMAAPTDPMAGMPAPQTFANGVQGYSSQPMFQQALDAFAKDRPGQFAAMSAPFIDPVTGAAPGTPFGNGNAVGQMPMARAGGVANGAGGQARRSYAPTGQSGAATRSSNGGFISFGDMFDGGGPGASGSQFSGGPTSGAANSIGINPAKPSGYSRASGMGGRK